MKEIAIQTASATTALHAGHRNLETTALRIATIARMIPIDAV
jgi:hypothetical protein